MGSPYVTVTVLGHPYARRGGKIFKHRVVMEKFLGRYLTPNEVVHHINYNTKDNRVENLQLFKNNGTHTRHHAIEAKKKKGPNMVCGFCKKAFYTFPCRIKRKPFCSPKCYFGFRRNGIDSICPTCGTGFYRKMSRFSESKTHYCSSDCWYKRSK